jgi:Bacterial Ig-like domain (group 3)
MLSAGLATFSTTALTQGSHTITAQYGGNSTFKASTSPAISQTVNATPDFTVTVSPSSLTLAAGSSGMVAVTITPVNGSTQMVSLSCSGLPRGASCSASSAVTLDGTHAATSQLTFSTTMRGITPGPPPIATPGTVTRMLAVLGLCFGGMLVLSLLRTRSIAWRVAFAMCVFAVPLTVLVACAGNPGNSTGLGTPIGTYTVTVNASSGTDIHSTPVTLNVQ